MSSHRQSKIIGGLLALSASLTSVSAFQFNASSCAEALPPRVPQLPPLRLLTTTANAITVEINAFPTDTQNLSCLAQSIVIQEAASRQVLWQESLNASASTAQWRGLFVGETYRARLSELEHATTYELSASILFRNIWNSPSYPILVRTSSKPPGAPTHLRVVMDWRTPIGVGIRWHAPIEDGGRPVEEYRIERAYLGHISANETRISPSSIDPSSTRWSLSATHPSTVRAANISGLLPGSLYALRVQAENLIGVGQPTTLILGATRPALPCPLGCSGNGECHQWNGKCTCDFSYTGNGCSMIAGAVVEMHLQANIQSFIPSDIQSLIASGLGLQGYGSLRVHILSAQEGSAQGTVAQIVLLTKEYIMSKFSLAYVLGGPEPLELVQQLASAAILNQGWFLGIGVVQLQRASSNLSESSIIDIPVDLIPTDAIRLQLPSCSLEQTCGSCLELSGCGWCATTMTCSQGTRSGPSSRLDHCPTEQVHYIHPSGLNPQCPPSCGTLSSCTQCSSRQDCAWCDGTGTCTSRKNVVEDSVGVEGLSFSGVALQSMLEGISGPMRCGQPVVSSDSCPSNDCEDILSPKACLASLRCGLCSLPNAIPMSTCKAGDSFGWTDTSLACTGDYAFARSDESCSGKTCQSCREASSCGWCESSQQCGPANVTTGAPMQGTCSDWILPEESSSMLASIAQQNLVAVGSQPDGTAPNSQVAASLTCPIDVQSDLAATCASMQSCGACTEQVGCGWCQSPTAESRCMPQLQAKNGGCPRLSQDEVGAGGLADPPFFVDTCPLSCAGSQIETARCGEIMLQEPQSILRSSAWIPSTQVDHRYYPFHTSGCVWAIQPMVDDIVGQQAQLYGEVVLQFNGATGVGASDAFLVYRGTPGSGDLLAVVTGDLQEAGDTLSASENNSESAVAFPDGVALADVSLGGNLSMAHSRESFDDIIETARQVARVWTASEAPELHVSGGLISIVFVSAVGGRRNFNVSYCGVGAAQPDFSTAIVVVAVLATLVVGGIVLYATINYNRREDIILEDMANGNEEEEEQDQEQTMPGFLIRQFPAFKFDKLTIDSIPALTTSPKEPQEIAKVVASATRSTKSSGTAATAQGKPLGLVASRVPTLPSDRSECSICMCELETGETVRMLGCMHLFHAACVDRWLLAKPQCPMCRANTIEMAVILQSRIDSGESNPLGFGTGISLISPDDQEDYQQAECAEQILIDGTIDEGSLIEQTETQAESLELGALSRDAHETEGAHHMHHDGNLPPNNGRQVQRVPTRGSGARLIEAAISMQERSTAHDAGTVHDTFEVHNPLHQGRTSG